MPAALVVAARSLSRDLALDAPYDGPSCGCCRGRPTMIRARATVIGTSTAVARARLGRKSVAAQRCTFAEKFLP